ncbi:serine hydrolase [Aquibacillus sp. 3ASR75-11]|uniref:Serine hydrolase n=1 Tax=Terrihalobacillus insolitus TaxID=2950438 RepID=A0A9X4AN37_9BACI|nr:serine hydrolase [Terrihalobacillus insolitus]MDC3414045.1 serine hydrolase [Terrihalobacillus insolitus]MDC3424135.1 serine hydrolase [Terrihalobacillus insolitus]
MQKNNLIVAIVSALTVSIAFPGISRATGDLSKNQSQSSIQGENELRNSNQTFSWENPGPSSSVLHPGSAMAAGLIASPLRKIDSVVEQSINEKVMPGAVVLIARRGTIAKQEAYGYAARYTNDQFSEMTSPMTMQTDTIFDLASVSKLFTTTAAMILYEDNAFELDDPVAKYIPEFEQNGKENVTIRQLMTHTSGFKPWIPLYTMGENREERLQIVLSQPLDNEPGETYSYSDLNMITLGILVERLSGKRLDAFVKDTITEPLDMSDTMYNPPENLKGRIAATEYQPWTDRGLVWGEVHDENAWSLDGVAGHAGVFSTAKDLAIFAQMMLQEGKYGGTRVLEPDTVKLLAENQIPQFPDDTHGLGWELDQGWYMDALSGSGAMGHTGYTGTSIVVNPNNATIAILLTNRVHPTRNTVSSNEIRREVAQLTADAIPVAIPDKGDAWFSGYGNNRDATLITNVNLNEEATLTFNTWFRTELINDYGVIEVSEDGTNWEPIGDKMTGNSEKWLIKTVNLPKNTTYIRFNYRTDNLINGRGWYVNNIKLTTKNGNEIPIKWGSDFWIERDY